MRIFSGIYYFSIKTNNLNNSVEQVIHTFQTKQQMTQPRGYQAHK